ncbi:hypothetical protein D9Q98_008087 [Chlorella vulgaris]|uniref:SAP domain-containing protein n=1 Tax=Chlorella vulgaris TaxID=3077 RepID=A0A9D4TG03_CHLVU|nr:hypothetical protein D9Q98_008087 [Chlorella vulgaris]
MDEWNESIYAEEAQEEEEHPPSKEQVLFLIDASPAMLDPCEVDEAEDQDKDFAGLSWLEAAVKVALHIMRQKIIAASSDELGVVLYSAEKSVTSHGHFNNCYELQDLQQPGAEAVQKLEAFSRQFFEREVGSATYPASLTNAIWLSKVMAKSSKGSRASMRIMVFTRNQQPFARFDKGHDPSQKWNMLRQRLNPLREEAGSTLELYPMVPPGETFDLEPFWRAVLHHLRGAASADGSEEVDEAQQVFRLRDLFSVVRSRAHKKRSVASVTWKLGGGLELAVKLYQLLQPQTKGNTLRISAQTGYQVKPVQGQVDMLTGAVLEADNPAAQFFFKKQGTHEPRYPKVYMTSEEVASIKGQGHSGMELLGFKPLSCLKEHHNWRNSTFVYPDDGEQAGSATCFIALWQAMRESGTMAICRLAATKARTPCLVALLPQQEELYQDDSQATPPGLQLIYLPFADDCRQPEAQPSFTGGTRPPPNESQVAAAELLMAQLQMADFDPGSVLNPTLQRHYEVLEALAAAEEPPLLEDSALGGDPTLPAWGEEAGEGEEEEVVAARMAAILGFKASGGGGEGLVEAVGLDAEPAKKGVKRAAAAPPDAEAVAALGIEAKAKAGTLAALTIPQLKDWLRANHLPLGGKKDELVQRIMTKLGV